MKSSRDNRKTILLLAVLLAIFAGTLVWHWVNRDRPSAAVRDETEHEALSTFLELVEVGRARGWSKTESYWLEMPERQTQGYYQQLMGSRFQSDFTFQGSAPVEGHPEQVILYGMFEAGVPLQILLSRGEEGFKVVSMSSM